MKTAGLGIALVGLLAFAGVVFAQAMFRGDAAHDGAYRGDGPRQFHRVKWKFPTGDRIVSSPVYQDGVIYFGSDDGNVYAVDAADGPPALEAQDRRARPVDAGDRGRRRLRGQLRRQALCARREDRRRRSGNSPRKASGDSRRRACTACCRRTRRSPMRSTSSCRARSSAGGSVYFGSGDGHVYALDAASGALNWKFRTGDVVHASPAYADGVVYFGSWDSYFYAVDAKTGAEKWRFHGGEDPAIHNQVGFQSSPAVVNGVVYTGCRDSKLYALDAATGREKWHFDAGGSWVISSPAVAQGKVDLRHLGFEPLRRARRRHRHASSSGSRASPSCSRRRRSRAPPSTSASSTARWRRAISRAAICCGSIRPKRRSATRAGCSPRTGSSTRRCSTRRAGARLRSSRRRRQFGVGSIFSSPLVVGGVVYFGSTDGNLYAVE